MHPFISPRWWIPITKCFNNFGTFINEISPRDSASLTLSFNLITSGTVHCKQEVESYPVWDSGPCLSAWSGVCWSGGFGDLALLPHSSRAPCTACTQPCFGPEADRWGRARVQRSTTGCSGWRWGCSAVSQFQAENHTFLSCEETGRRWQRWRRRRSQWSCCLGRWRRLSLTSSSRRLWQAWGSVIGCDLTKRKCCSAPGGWPTECPAGGAEPSPCLQLHISRCHLYITDKNKCIRHLYRATFQSVLH